MNTILQGLRSNPVLWLLAAVPAVFLGEHFAPESHTALFVLAVLAIVPLAALLSHATESVAAKTGDAVGGLLNATLGNLTELVIAITALRAGMFDLVKASIAGAIVTNSLKIAMFVAPVLVLLSLFIAPSPMDLQFWPGAVIMVMFSTLTVLFITNTGRSAWFIGVMLLVVYTIFAMTLYLLPPANLVPA